MKHSRSVWLKLAGVGLAGIPTTTAACEPIIPLTHLMSGANIVGPMLLLKSFTWLLIAVAIKSTAFVLLERRLPWPKAMLFMLVANALSTIPGILAAVFAGVFAIVAVPII